MSSKIIYGDCYSQFWGGFIIILSVILSFVGWCVDDVSLTTWPMISFLIGFYLVLYTEGRMKLYDPMILMPCVATLYCIATPVLGSCLNVISFLASISEREVVNSTFYCEIYIYTFSMLTLIFHNNIDVNSFSKIFNTRRSLRNLFAEIYMWIFAILVVSLYNQSGAWNKTLDGATRADVVTMFNTVPFYVYQSYIFIGFAIYLSISFFNSKTMVQKISHLFGMIPVLIFFVVNLLTGNRRELTYYLIAMTVYIVYKKKGKINKKMIAICVLIITVLLIISLNRAFSSIDFISDDIKYYSVFGEFINPIYTLRYYLSIDVDLKYGLTYLNFIPMFIPKDIWPDKPESLAIDYVKETNAGMGYGFMPETEAYINFGILGCVLGGLMHFCFCRIICKNSSAHPYLFLALFCQLLNIFRGEFSSTFTEMIIISFALYMSSVLNRKPRKTPPNT